MPADSAGGTRVSDPAWYQTTVDEAFERTSSRRTGLASDDAQRRLDEHGPNRFGEEQVVSGWRVLADQFTSPLIYVLIGALAITLTIGHYADAIVIGLVLAVNASIGFVQEYRAQTAVLSLMALVAPRATVRRDGRVRTIAAEQVVPGDVVVLRQGEVVPADVRLVDVHGLRLEEATLTGESVPVDKHSEPIPDEHLTPADQRNMAFMGTSVSSGDAFAVVVATGIDTEIGKIAEQVQEAGDTTTPLEDRISRLARWITIAILGVAAVTFFAGLLLGRDAVEMLLVGVALAVSAIPEGLPVVVTVALAIGVNRMAGRNALVRHLAAVETLGSTTTILSDKTGTLTQNRMTVQTIVAGSRRFTIEGPDDARRIVADDGHPADLDAHLALADTLLVGLLCNDAPVHDDPPGNSDDASDDASDQPDDSRPVGDPMETALVRAAADVGLQRERLLDQWPMRHKIPFRTEQRFMATVHEHVDGSEAPLVLVKGAPERIIEMCDRRRTDDGDEAIDRDSVLALSDVLAAEGLRVLAMAVGRGADAADRLADDEPRGFVLTGLQGLLDPPRDSAIDAVDGCHDAGIRVRMVTGDHARTAAAIAEQVHIDVRAGVRTGRQIAELSDDELDRTLADTDVFARVAPDQKTRLVQRLMATGEVVAVTGDGVNDAPALRSAHLGAAMGSGTDVAKEASDMVITDDNFASVYAAVQEGRTAFRNIRMATFFLLSTGVAEVIFILTTLALDWPLPLLPAQILWLNVVTNGIADVALAFEPGDEGLYRRRPRPPREGVLDARLIERLVVVGLWFAAGSLFVFWWQWQVQGADLTTARTTVLTTLVLFQSVHVFNCRSEYGSVFAKSLLANKILLVGVAVSVAIHVAATSVGWLQDLLRLEPVSLATWGLALAVGLTAVVVNEAHKRLRPPPRPTVQTIRAERPM